MPSILIFLTLLTSFFSFSAEAKWKPTKTSKKQTVLLQTILDNVSNHKGKNIVVFALDSTIIDNRPRTMHILQEFGAREKIPQFSKLKLEYFDDRSMERPLKKIGLHKKDIDRISDSLQVFWKERFFHPAYASYDTALPGAAMYLQNLAAHGAIIAYVGNRKESSRKTIEHTLRRLGFPFRHKHTLLFLKSKTSQENDDTKHKQEIAKHLQSLGSVIAIFDNEPKDVNLYADLFKDARIVFVDTDHSQQSDKPHTSITKIHGFIMK